MGIVFSGLMCHAPIVVAEVGGEETKKCGRTTSGMREVAERAVASSPDRIVVISPHSPRDKTKWGAWKGTISGNLGRFNAPEVRVSLPEAAEVRTQLGLVAIQDEEGLDHGAMVPLVFLTRAGWEGPTAVISVPWDATEAEQLGLALRDLDGRTCVIASGDMSHRLKPGAPAGYDPKGAQFDEAFVAALVVGDWQAATHSPFREEAAEDVIDSCRVAMAAAPSRHQDEVISYEGPWGVGYTEAVFYDEQPPVYAIARQAIRAAVMGERYEPPTGGPGPAAAFVTLTKEGNLRGCIGTLAPTVDGLWEEVARIAPESALQDPRFPRVTPGELGDLDIEVSVLEAPESIEGRDQLDPIKYGVIVTKGRRRGVLLPDLEGVDTVDKQIFIACRKAGIPDGAKVNLQRFKVTKVAQPSVI